MTAGHVRIGCWAAFRGDRDAAPGQLLTELDYFVADYEAYRL